MLACAPAFGRTYRIAAGSGAIPDSLPAAPGDSILLERGGSFRGTLQASASGTEGKPIFYGAYGKGAPPMVKGTVPVTGWRRHRGGIYVADCPRYARQLFLDGAALPLARHPDRGYFAMGKTRDDIAFGVPAGMALGNWAGAAVHVRSERFSLDARVVADQDTVLRILKLDRGTNYPMRAGWGFFLNGALAALDAPGEWFCDSVAGKLYLWPPGGDSPSSHRVEASVFANGFQSTGHGHFAVEGLRFSGHYRDGVSLEGAFHVRISRCNIKDPGRRGISGEGNHLRIEEDTVAGSVQSGIRLDGSGSAILQSQVVSTGMPGRLGREGFGGGCCKGNGIDSYGDENRLAWNRVVSSALNGIRFDGAGNLIEENVIDSSCRVFDDGAGIHTWAPEKVPPGSAGSLIRRNTILNSLGNPEGTPDTGRPGNGIYIDHRNSGDRVEGNIIANTDIGIYLHDAANNRVMGNLLYANRSSQIGLKRDYLDIGGMSGNHVRGNLFFAAGPGQETSLQTRYEVPDTGPLGEFSGNYHCVEDTVQAVCRLDSIMAMRRPGGPPAYLLMRDRDSLISLHWEPRGLRRRAEAYTPRSMRPGRSAPYIFLSDSLILAPP